MIEMANFVVLFFLCIFIDIAYGRAINLNTVIRIQNYEDTGFIMIESPSGEQPVTTYYPSSDEVADGASPAPFIPILSSEGYVMTWRINWGEANRGGSYIAADDDDFATSKSNRYLCKEKEDITEQEIGIMVFKKSELDSQRGRCLWKFVPIYDPENYVNNYQVVLADSGHCMTKCGVLNYCSKKCDDDDDLPRLYRILQNNYIR